MQLRYYLLFFSGVIGSCNASQKAQEPPRPIAIEETHQVPVMLDTFITFPPSRHEEKVPLTGTDTSFVWDWGPAQTTINISPEPTPKEPPFILVRTEIKKIKIPVTIRDTVAITIRDTITVQGPCPEPAPKLPAAPAAGSGGVSWIYWGFGVLVALLYSLINRKRKE